MSNYHNALAYYNKNNKYKIIVQEFHPGPYEVGVLFERLPFRKKGKIISIVQKQLDPNNFKPLRCRSPSKCYDKNTVGCTDRPAWITPELTDSINQISINIPNFYAGRYDIRFENINDFKKGINFKVLELNCTMGFDLRQPIEKSYIKFLYYTITWIFRRFVIGIVNVLMFNGINIFKLPLYFYYGLKYAIMCEDWERFFQPNSS
uniref:Uncharacterized protein n=1 Tax=Mimivirus LCMiAC01 TaxID=2506608 RepID=A0A481Z293_9VIRU|nr:MAG: hypothetical protein LCMiAC01_05860 [Mimivirus LCMiAC01]